MRLMFLCLKEIGVLKMDNSGNNLGQKPPYSLEEREIERTERVVESGRDSESPNTFTIHVEGPDDYTFYDKWRMYSKLESAHRKLAIKIKKINDDKSVKASGPGNCQKIRDAAEKYKDDVRRIYISDRDLMTESEVEKYSHLNSLFFTDFPAVESYGFSDEILCGLNKDKYGGNLDLLDSCYEFLKFYLRFLYFHRCKLNQQKNPESMNKAAWGLHRKLLDYIDINPDNLSIDLFIDFVGVPISSEMREILELMDDDDVDPRVYAYGHDIAAAVRQIVVKREGELISRYARQKVEYIEQYIRDAYIEKRLYEHDSLFQALRKRIEDLYNLTAK